MVAHIPYLRFGLDPLIAEAKRRARQRRLGIAALLVALAAATGAAVFLASSNGSASAGPGPLVRVATFAVKSVNPSKLVDGTYVTVSSSAPLSRHRLATEPLFNVTGQFTLVHRAHGARICSFSKRIERSVMFPNANGSTVRVDVYRTDGSVSVARVCHAFETFSLSYIRQPPPHGRAWPPVPPALPRPAS